MTSDDPAPTHAAAGAESRLEATLLMVAVGDDRPDDVARARVQDLMQQRHDDLADRAENPARQPTTVAAAPRWGHRPDHDLGEIAAREFDVAAGELRDLRRELAEAEVLPDAPRTPGPESRRSLRTDRHLGLVSVTCLLESAFPGKEKRDESN